MGTVAVQTQCCLAKSEEWEDDKDGESVQEVCEGAAVQLVAEPVSWNGRSDGPPGASPRPQKAAVPRSLREATTIVPNRR